MNVSKFHLGAFVLKFSIYEPDFILLKSLYRDFIPVLIVPAKSGADKIMIGWHWQFKPCEEAGKLYLHDYNLTPGFDNTKTFNFNANGAKINISKR